LKSVDFGEYSCFTPLPISSMITMEGKKGGKSENPGAGKQVGSNGSQSFKVSSPSPWWIRRFQHQRRLQKVHGGKEVMAIIVKEASELGLKPRQFPPSLILDGVALTRTLINRDREEMLSLWFTRIPL